MSNEAPKEATDVDTSAATPIAPPVAKKPELLQDIDSIRSIADQKLSKEALTALLFRADGEGRALKDRADRLQLELQSERQALQDSKIECAVLSERIKNSSPGYSTLLSLLGALALGLWGVWPNSAYGWTLLGLGAAFSAAAVILMIQLIRKGS